MHIFGVAFIVASITYSVLQQRQLILYFGLTVIIYLLLSFILPGARSLSNRQKIMAAAWQVPAEGNLRARVRCRVQKIQQIIKQCKSSQTKLTLTHFVIKAVGNMIKSCPQINGKLTFGKFVPHSSVDVSCLVDIDGGKDLALVLVKDVDKKSVQQIAQFIKEKGSRIKASKGDIDHKKRTRVADIFPAFIISVFLQISRFCVNKLGISIQPLALRRHQFGAACVTSLGMLNFEYATPPFSAFTDCTMLIAANAVQNLVAVQDGKVVAARIMMCNFTIDSRHIDMESDEVKNMIKSFNQVFQKPELFVSQKQLANKQKN